MKLSSVGRLLFDTASPLSAVLGRFRYRLGMRPLPQGFQWARKVMYEELSGEIRSLDPRRLGVLEISPGEFWQQQEFRSYKAVGFPEFDICSDVLDEKFDLIIADQVFEHILWPYRAARNVRSMLKEDGIFIVTTPFLIRVHDHPVDCSRWTELGMRHLLAEAGFELDRIKTGSWGNKACVVSNLKHTGWASLTRFSTLRNDPTFPCVVWAIARR